MSRVSPLAVDGVEIETPLSAITATATSAHVQVAGAKGVAIQFTEGGTVLNRSGVLTITVSVDGGASFQAFSMLLDNAANSSVQGLTRVASKTRASAGTDLMWIEQDILKGITHLKATVTITDSSTPTGNFTVIVAVCY